MRKSRAKIQNYLIMLKLSNYSSSNVLNLMLLTFSILGRKYPFSQKTRFVFKGNVKKSSVNVCLIKILKITVTEKVIVRFNNLGKEKI